MSHVAFVSFRLGGNDGVSIEAAKWMNAMDGLGWNVTTVAGSGQVDCLVPGLGIDDHNEVDLDQLTKVLSGADLIIVENLCSLPLNPPALEIVASVCRGRPAILHHHDLPWQRPHLAHFPLPPDDPHWRHVTINRRSQHELAERGIAATTIYNTFDPEPVLGDRTGARRRLGLSDTDRLVLQPTRALERKNVPGAIELATAVNGIYWLLGPAEDGYGPTLERLLSEADCPVISGLGSDNVGARISDAYAASDLVALPSWWEGFGNPAVESAAHRRPLAIGPYPVAGELIEQGFRWFAWDDFDGINRFLAKPDVELIEHNAEVVRRSFSTYDLAPRIASVLHDMGLG